MTEKAEVEVKKIQRIVLRRSGACVRIEVLFLFLPGKYCSLLSTGFVLNGVEIQMKSTELNSGRVNFY